MTCAWPQSQRNQVQILFPPCSWASYLIQLSLTTLFSKKGTLILGVLWGLSRGFSGGSVVKNPPAKQEMPVWPLSWVDFLEKERTIHSSILAWEIPQTEEPGGYSPWGPKESDRTERLSSSRGLSEMIHKAQCRGQSNLLCVSVICYHVSKRYYCLLLKKDKVDLLELTLKDVCKLGIKQVTKQFI